MKRAASAPIPSPVSEICIVLSARGCGTASSRNTPASRAQYPMSAWETGSVSTRSVSSSICAPGVSALRVGDSAASLVLRRLKLCDLLPEACDAFHADKLAVKAYLLARVPGAELQKQ